MLVTKIIIFFGESSSQPAGYFRYNKKNPFSNNSRASNGIRRTASRKIAPWLGLGFGLGLGLRIGVGEGAILLGGQLS